MGNLVRLRHRQPVNQAAPSPETRRVAATAGRGSQLAYLLEMSENDLARLLAHHRVQAASQVLYLVEEYVAQPTYTFQPLR